MWRYISFAFVRQFNFISWLLWDSGQFGTASDYRRLCLFNTRPVGRLSVRTIRSRWVLWIHTSDPGSLRALFFVWRSTLRFGPGIGSHYRCAGLTQSNEIVSALPFFLTLPLLATTLYGPL